MTTAKTPANTLSDVAHHIAEHHPDILATLVNKKRRQLSDLVGKFHKNTVAHGPFKGLQLHTDAHWGGADRGVMLLGLYEREILDALASKPTKYETLIDLGAADGYYGVGVLVNNLCKNSYCYEITQNGRDTIQKNADLNGLADRITIRGEATKSFYDDISEDERSRSILLIDIEGGEFDIVDGGTFAAFRNSIILIEVHDWLENAEAKILKMRADSDDTHTITALVTGARDLSQFRELRMMSDTDRWLLCSEGRPRLMSWLRFDPIV